MKNITKVLSAATLLISVSGTANAGLLNATIVEENGGSIGVVTWTVIDEKGFIPVLEGKGGHIKADLDPGRYIVSVDGDTQGREAVKIEKGVKSIKISTRKFY